MRNSIKLIPLAVATAIVATTAAPAHAAGVDARARAITITPLNIIKVDDLDFGTFVAGDSAGTISIDAATGARTASDGAGAVPGGTPGRATFVTAGSENQQFLITLSAPPVLTNGTGGAMPIASLVLDGPATRAHDSTRAMHIGVGGVLSVDSYQEEGDYSAEFTMSVEYF